MKLAKFATLLLVSALFAGCRHRSDAGGPDSTPNGTAQSQGTSAETAIDPNEPQAAQPRLPTIALWVGPDVMTTELATTEQEERTGMMFRDRMGENEAMLFVFPIPQRTSFWMKNTRVPLSAAYISADGVILEIHDLQPFNTNGVVAQTDQVQYVLETPQGWFVRHHVNTGALIRTERGSLQDSFFRRR